MLLRYKKTPKKTVFLFFNVYKNVHPFFFVITFVCLNWRPFIFYDGHLEIYMSNKQFYEVITIILEIPSDYTKFKKYVKVK